MLVNEKTLADMVTSVATELATLFREFEIPEDVITEVSDSLVELLRSKSTSTSYTLKIDRWPVAELQRIFDKAHFGGADFTAKTWIEIVLDFKNEKVTVKRSLTQIEPEVLYERKRQTEPTM